MILLYVRSMCESCVVSVIATHSSLNALEFVKFILYIKVQCLCLIELSYADADDVLARTTIIGVILCFRALLLDGLQDVSNFDWL